MKDAARERAGSSPRRQAYGFDRRSLSPLVLLWFASLPNCAQTGSTSRVTLEISPAVVQKGARVAFVCKTQSSSAIRWKFNGDSMPSGPGRPDVTAGSRVIDRADVADGGTYACAVEIGGGREETSAGTTLGVYTIPVISEPPQNESAHVGQNIVFSAGISNFYGGSAAQAQAQWRAEDGRHLNPDDLYVNDTASGFVRLTQTLRNAKLSDSMTYIFVLSSPHWPTLMRSFELTVEPVTVIIPPNNLKFPVAELTHSSFKLTWTYLPGSQPIARFVFHYGKFTKEAGPQDSSLIVSGLESCETYEVYGIAEGLKGQVSKLSDVVSVTTSPSPLASNQIWSDGNEVIVRYRGESLPLCIEDVLTDRQLSIVCDLLALLPVKAKQDYNATTFKTKLTFTTDTNKLLSTMVSLLQSCFHESVCSNNQLGSLETRCNSPTSNSVVGGGLSSGDIAGIVIALALLCVIGVGGYIIWKKKRRASKAIFRQSGRASDDDRNGTGRRKKRASITKRRRSESIENVLENEEGNEDNERDDRPALPTRNQTAPLLRVPSERLTGLGRRSPSLPIKVANYTKLETEETQRLMFTWIKEIFHSVKESSEATTELLIELKALMSKALLRQIVIEDDDDEDEPPLDTGSLGLQMNLTRGKMSKDTGSDFGSATSMNSSVMKSAMSEVDILRRHMGSPNANKKEMIDKLKKILTMLAENRRETLL